MQLDVPYAAMYEQAHTGDACGLNQQNIVVLT